MAASSLSGLPFVQADGDAQRVEPGLLGKRASPSLLWFGTALLAAPGRQVRLPKGELDLGLLTALRDALTALGFDWVTGDGGVALQQTTRRRVAVALQSSDPELAATVLLAAAQPGASVELSGLPVTSELVELAQLLNQLGAQVAGVGTPVAYVGGGARSKGGAPALPIEVRPPRDRREALFLLVGSALGPSRVVRDVPSHRMRDDLLRLQRAGLQVRAVEDGLGCSGTPQPFDLEQPDDPCLWIALALCAEGASVLSGAQLRGRAGTELVTELVRIGADVLPRGELLYLGGGRERAPRGPVGTIKVEHASAALALLLLGQAGLLPGAVIEVTTPTAAAAAGRFAEQTLG